MNSLKSNNWWFQNPSIRSKVCEMISQFNSYLAFSAIGRGNDRLRFNTSHVSYTVRCFKKDSDVFRERSSSQDSSPSPTRFFVHPVSRVSRKEAQEVLFDYFHCTRNLSFTDAEHISKNSPHFISTLLSKIDTRTDISRTLTKYLRYNPVNEFEPFFESLGLQPSEFSPFLPQHLMYITDDYAMFENFHVLCNYGVPRGKIGHMYKEAREIFRYESGVLASKLEAYERLGLNQPAIIKLVSCCPLLLTGGLDSEFVSVLEKLKRLEVGYDWLGRYLSNRRTFNWHRMLDTIEFLGRVGYKGEELSKLLKTYPDLVIKGSGKKVCVLFGRLYKVGLQMSEVCLLFRDHPEMLSDKFAKNLWKTLDFLIDIGMEIQLISMILLTHMKLIGSCSLRRPKTICRSLKVERSELCLMLKEDPLKLFSFTYKSKARKREPVSHDSNAEKTAFLLKLGYVENTDDMEKALKKFRGRGDQLQVRFDCLVKAGLDHSAVVNIIKQAPMILNQSKDVIERKIHSLTDQLGYPIESLIAFPAYLCYDLDRIHHRISMYMWLRERNVAKPMMSLSTIITCADHRFLRYFVNVHPEGPATWDIIKKSASTDLDANKWGTRCQRKQKE